MFKQLRFQNFKSWQDTGEIKLAPITGFFGTNSSGKSAILQFLLMLKQTMESSDRQRVLHTGDEKTYVNLGTIYDIAYNHKIPSEIVYQLEWKLPNIIDILETNLPSLSTNKLFSVDHLTFTSEIQLEKDNIFIKQLCYRFNFNSQDFIFKFHHRAFDSELNTRNYILHTQGYELKRRNEYQYKKTLFMLSLSFHSL